jgi:hypothetical protein
MTVPLYDPDLDPDLPPEQAILAVRRFLLQARAWASEREIPRRAERVGAGAPHDEAAKLHAWVAWRDFIDRAVRELEDGTLDGWFDAP